MEYAHFSDDDDDLDDEGESILPFVPPPPPPPKKKRKKEEEGSPDLLLMTPPPKKKSIAKAAKETELHMSTFLENASKRLNELVMKIDGPFPAVTGTSVQDLSRVLLAQKEHLAHTNTFITAYEMYCEMFNLFKNDLGCWWQSELFWKHIRSHEVHHRIRTNKPLSEKEMRHVVEWFGYDTTIENAKRRFTLRSLHVWPFDSEREFSKEIWHEHVLARLWETIQGNNFKAHRTLRAAIGYGTFQSKSTECPDGRYYDYFPFKKYPCTMELYMGMWEMLRKDGVSEEKEIKELPIERLVNSKGFVRDKWQELDPVLDQFLPNSKRLPLKKPKIGNSHIANVVEALRLFVERTGQPLFND